MRSLVRLRGVTRRFGREEVLRGVDLDLPEGTVTALLARNGAGKSTLLRITAGLLARDGGEAETLGKDPERLHASDRSRMALVTDASGAPSRTRVADEVALHRAAYGERWRDEAFRALAARFEVPLGKRMGELSKGTATRLRVVLAMSADPDLLLLDEPALGLDLVGRQQLVEAIVEAAAAREGCAGRAVLLASHLIDDVERVADRVAFLHGGRIVACDEIEALRDRHRAATLALGAGGEPALREAARALLGIRSITAPDPAAPPGERQVIFDRYDDALLSELEARSGARRASPPRRLALREIALALLGSDSRTEDRS